MLGSVAGMEFREAAVGGLGTMGAGIAEVLARGGLPVVAIEADDAALARGMSILHRSLARAVATLLLPYLNHAVTLLETGYATRDDIDAAASEGIGLPMGPLAPCRRTQVPLLDGMNSFLAGRRS
jgi:3-hydroxyacyl-CoA dehydrogenase